MPRDLVVLNVERLNRERIRRGMTREQTAERARVSVNSVRRALSGEPVGLRVSKSVVEVLGFELADVIVEPSGRVAG